ILQTCRELGIGVTAYGVLSRGLLSGNWSKERKLERDFRGISPRFQGENLERNLKLVDKLREVAEAHGGNPAQLALAWALTGGADIVPLVGARRRPQLQDAIAALEVRLSADELAQIEAAVPAGAVSGARYNEIGMKHLDSERQHAAH